MIVRQFHTGGDRNFGYLAADEKSGVAALIDPSPSPEEILRFAGENEFDIAYVLCTHGHSDHIVGTGRVARETGRPALLLGDTEPVTGLVVAHGARFPLGTLELAVLHTPGHTADSICVLLEDAVFTGDTLFVGKVGGTGFGADARAQYDSIHQVLLELPDQTRVFPGHDYGTTAESTLGREKETNPFLLRRDFDSFLDLKKNWAVYKKEHGID